MFQWAIKSHAFQSTYDIGFAGWFFLLGGAVAFLRAVGRGRRLWEPVTLVILACLPPVWSAVGNIFHPEDLVAMGLALGGIACALRRWWAWAGILVALAVLSQQFALLVAAPLFVLVPADRRLRYSVAALTAAAVVVAPLLVFGSSKVIRAITLGSGSSSGAGGTAVRALRLHGWLLVSVARVLPIVLSMVLAWWLMRRLGQSARDPLPLTALIALSLSLRLVFEENLHHTYYYMALAVVLILLDVIRGHIRGSLVAWIALTTCAYNAGLANLFSGVPWQQGGVERLPQVLMVLGVILIGVDIARRRVRWYLVAWLILMVFAFGTWPLSDGPVRAQLPFWFWQLVLVPTGIVLAARPLLEYMRSRPQADAQRAGAPPTLNPV